MDGYRIERRTYNIGVDERSPFGIGFGHTFLVLSRIHDGKEEPVKVLHAFSTDRKTGEVIGSDLFGRGRLEGHEFDAERDEKNFQRYKFMLDDSTRNPRFTVFEGSKQEADGLWSRFLASKEWLKSRNIRYRLKSDNSNAAINTFLRDASIHVTGEPIDRDTGRHLPAPGATNYLRESLREKLPEQSQPPRQFMAAAPSGGNRISFGPAPQCRSCRAPGMRIRAIARSPVSRPRTRPIPAQRFAP